MPQDDTSIFVQRIVVLFKPERSPPPSDNAEPTLTGDQARHWHKISSQFGGLSLTPNSRSPNGAYFTIEVPPGEDVVALANALRSWEDLKSVQVEMLY